MRLIAMIGLAGLLFVGGCQAPRQTTPTATPITSPFWQTVEAIAREALQPTAVPTPRPTPLPARTAIPWSDTVIQLSQQSTAPERAEVFTTWKGRSLKLKAPGAAVHLVGALYQYTQEGNRTIMAIDTASDLMDSDPVVVVSAPLTGTPDPRRALDVSGRFVGTITIADKFGIAVEAPVVVAQRIVQE